jgi:ribulose-phosphate 3-epimerase
MVQKAKSAKIEIIPSINVDNFEDAKEQIRLVEPYVKWAHLDVSDGVFTKHVSWHDPKDLVGYKTKLKLEVHLMINEPEKEIDQWLQKNVSRIIFHQESTKNHQLLIDKIHDAKKEAGIAIKPDTPWLKLFPYITKVDLIQLLAVNPGPSGQQFNEGILHKLGHIRSVCKECNIEIDGGINKRIAGKLIHAGANALVASSAIFKASNIKKAIEELKIFS